MPEKAEHGRSRAIFPYRTKGSLFQSSHGSGRDHARKIPSCSAAFGPGEWHTLLLTLVLSALRLEVQRALFRSGG